jgi:hypothetical protein
MWDRGTDGARRRWATALAWALAALFALGMAATAWLDHLLRQAGRPDLVQLTAESTTYAVLGLVSATVALVMISWTTAGLAMAPWSGGGLATQRLGGSSS